MALNRSGFFPHPKIKIKAGNTLNSKKIYNKNILSTKKKIVKKNNKR
jgi:hypothetical protein